MLKGRRESLPCPPLVIPSLVKTSIELDRCLYLKYQELLDNSTDQDLAACV